MTSPPIITPSTAMIIGSVDPSGFGECSSGGPDDFGCGGGSDDPPLTGSDTSGSSANSDAVGSSSGGATQASCLNCGADVFWQSCPAELCGSLISPVSGGLMVASASDGYIPGSRQDINNKLITKYAEWIGVLAGKLNDPLEIWLFKHFMEGSAAPVPLTDIQFNEVVTSGRRYSAQEPVTLNNGESGFRVRIDLSKDPKYDYAIGQGTLYLNSNNQPVGFYDLYDFNKATHRNPLAEAATQAGDMMRPVFGAQIFEIYYGYTRQ